MLVVMKEARKAIREITAQTGRSVVAEPFEVLPDSREAELVRCNLFVSLALGSAVAKSEGPPHLFDGLVGSGSLRG